MASKKLSVLTTQALTTASEFYIQRSGIEGKTTLGAIQSALNIGLDQVSEVGTSVIMSTAERSKLQGIENNADSIPLGTLFPYAGSSAPNSDYLICDGQAVSRTTYASLFAIVGTTYGVGDGSTTFNLPDLRGRTILGEGTGTATDATAKALGAKAGTETHTLTVDEMPSHTHGLTQVKDVYDGINDEYRITNYTSTNISTGSTGSDDPHNNMQPYIVLNYIIKVL